MNIQQYQMQSSGTPAVAGSSYRTDDPRSTALFNLGLMDPRSVEYRRQQQMQPREGVMRELDFPGVPMAGQAPMSQYQYQQPGFRTVSPAMGATPPMGLRSFMGRRRRTAAYRHPQRDPAGNLPGEWDYRPPTHAPGFLSSPYGQQDAYQYPMTLR